MLFIIRHFVFVFPFLFFPGINGMFAPWPENGQVEQDLIIERAIVEIFTDPFLNENLAFRGGTALHKLFLKPQARYSEDIYLVQIKAGPIKPILVKIREGLAPFLGTKRKIESSIHNTQQSIVLKQKFNQ